MAKSLAEQLKDLVDEKASEAKIEEVKIKEPVKPRDVNELFNRR